MNTTDILIIGAGAAGRCNFTNLHTKPGNYLSRNPRFCVSALARYTPQDFIALITKHNIAYHEKTLGQLFCDGSAQQIIDMLVTECRTAGAELHLSTKVTGISMQDERFTVTTLAGEWRAASVVVASGGLSIPKMGASGFGYEIAKQFGIPLLRGRATLRSTLRDAIV